MELFNQYQFIGCDSDYESSEIVLFGAPFDGTSSYRAGSRFAPSKIRFDSYGLETYSPYSERDLQDYRIHDAGDLEFPFGNKEEVLRQIETFSTQLIEADKIPVMIGGEHLVSLGLAKVLAKKYPDLHVLHFDAHTDLRTDYMGEPLSHATVIRKIYDILGDGRIFQFGIRSGTKTEFDFAASGKHVYMNKFNTETLAEISKKLLGKPVYITIDLDILDPSIFPGTGTPEPGGISFNEMLDAILEFIPLNVVGADIVELSPDYDATGVSTAVASKLIREVMLAIK
ncbi:MULTISPECIES: agmatinase [unclassified Fusibacter]|uniref:agmatinase n=1 Tax=unclassified Fusibacter TaxID=2624464 RepID=UPI0010113E6E|nr:MULTISPECIES: agmatinase [unclassified Fusibacter]MCK8058813.1 agmatinase [Fusibacter sp. A2]NPE21887.1 agmatinase [Fusibacter sp. A1]RXV61459.1 agmatinase [Fusibacter sp. A1]